MQFVEANGAKIPAIGLGTWELRGRTCARLVEQALKLGYRHVDTAQVYENEREVGEGLRASKVRREDVFVTTKVWTTHFAPNDLERSTKESLTRLRLSEVDLLLLHWPNPQVPLAETLGALARVKKLGMVRHIGVSNFTVALIEEAVAACPEPLVCDQVEYHPYLDQTKVRRRARDTAWLWSPIVRSRRAASGTTRRWPGSGRRTARRRRKFACAGWCSRTFPRFRGRRGLSGCRKISTSSISRFRLRRCSRSPKWAAPRAGSRISVLRRNGIEAVAPAAMLAAIAYFRQRSPVQLR
jgi:2,5-diketo-D-gluconate reductase B